MCSVSLTAAQEAKAQDKVNKLIKAANKAFRSANPDYTDIPVDTNDAKISGALKGDDAALAKLRIDYVMANRSTATLDLLSVKTETSIDEANKYKMSAYVGAKRYRFDGSTWKSGYQLLDDEEPINSFIGIDGKVFQVLRAKGLFQLMTDAEVDEYTGKLPVDFETYFNLFM